MPSCRRTRRPSAVFLISLTRRSLSRFAMSFSIRIKNAWSVVAFHGAVSARSKTCKRDAQRERLGGGGRMQLGYHARTDACGFVFSKLPP